MSALEKPGTPDAVDEEVRAAALTKRPWPQPWMRAFLVAMTTMPNVAAACRVAGISRNRPYEWAKQDPEFRAAWDEAREIGVDLLERIAHQRATVGEERRTVRRREKRDASGKVIEVEEIVEEFVHVSDGILQTLLKAYRPEKFRERVDHRHSGTGEDGAIVVDEIERRPTRERILGLIKLANELEVPAVIDGTAERIENGHGPGGEDD